MAITEGLKRRIDYLVLLEVTHPHWERQQLADALGKSINSISKWRQQAYYTEQKKKMLLELWDDSIKIAQDTIINLAKQGDRQAAQYILDCHSYNAPKQVQLITSDINITITEDE